MGEDNHAAYITILEDQLQEYEQLSRFFRLSADLFCIAGFDGYFKKINPAVSELLGYTEEELLSRPINDFVFGDDQPLTSSSRSNIHRGKPLLNFENRYLTKQGEIVWLSWTSMPELEKGLVFAIAKNVTGKKRKEEEMNIFIEDLTRINQDLKQVTRMTSHDMRSPVNNLVAIFSLLDVSKIEDPETAELVNLLKVTSERLHETVNNFVDVLIRNDKSNVPVGIDKLSLPDTLRTVTDSISSLITDSGAAITADFSVYDCIPFNKIYLESIFLNLITNAIKYAHPDRPPEIRIWSKISHRTEQLVISDNGLGFDLKKVKARIFGLYQVFHNRPDSKGIGLHLVYTHVTALGGKITVDSKVNEGTTFTISFKK